MLDDLWRDIISIVGLALTVVGFLVTVVGFWIAIAQIRKTTSAAKAAEEAAKNALEESRKNFHRYVALCAHGCIKELKLHIQTEDWSRATIRVADLAEQMAQIDGSMAAKLRQWVDVFRKHEGDKSSTFANKKWESFLRKVESQIDGFNRPFAVPGEEI